jgi:hypothetical protein
MENRILLQLVSRVAAVDICGSGVYLAGRLIAHSQYYNKMHMLLELGPKQN